MPATLGASAPFEANTGCDGAFAEHTLPFATGVRIREIGTYISNGAGVAAGDLDNDGDLDLAFASVDGTSKVLRNDGGLHFTEIPLDAEFTRDVKMVDVYGSGWLDLVFTDRLGKLIYYANTGGQVVRSELPGVTGSVYTMGWADLNGDGRLDLVTGSYDTELRKRGVSNGEIAQNSGVFVYMNTGAGFTSQRLGASADALAIGLLDLNGDGATDIWVGNDFIARDAVWLRVNDSTGWQASAPFTRMSHSTMSIDWADIDNSGAEALFTTDMNPYDTQPRTWAEWLPMMSKTDQTKSGDPQISANVLQVRRDGSWIDEAPSRGIDATGWSWAGRFADLDRDGWQDLYVVNGMIASDLFAHLPGAELVEQNKAFHNTGAGRFEPAPAWKLGSQLSGRGMAIADLDNDGDLDIVVNNLRASASLFENRLCGGAGLTVKLAWPGSANTNAIGARAVLHTSAGDFQRDVRASGGYLSGDAPLMYFGLPNGATITSLEILWPDGAQSTVEPITSNSRIEVKR